MIGVLLLAATAAFDYQLVWADEFNIDGKPNPRNWKYETGFVRNKELQLYRPENVEVKDGFLIIEGRKEQVPNPSFDAAAPVDDWKRRREFAQFTSGSIRTLATWTFGRFECRGKFGVTLGLWPAFWSTGKARPWPANGEIDIMEYYQRAFRANVAWGSKTAHVGIWRSTASDIEKLAKESGYDDADGWSQDFHTYRMDWDREWIRLYVDDRLLNEVPLRETINESADHANPFLEPHDIILNLAIGATGGDPAKTAWPSRFVVDWVRVYQKAG